MHLNFHTNSGWKMKSYTSFQIKKKLSTKNNLKFQIVFWAKLDSSARLRTQNLRVGCILDALQNDQLFFFFQNSKISNNLGISSKFSHYISDNSYFYSELPNPKSYQQHNPESYQQHGHWYQQHPRHISNIPGMLLIFLSATWSATWVYPYKDLSSRL